MNRGGGGGGGGGAAYGRLKRETSNLCSPFRACMRKKQEKRNLEEVV